MDSSCTNHAFRTKHRPRDAQDVHLGRCSPMLVHVTWTCVSLDVPRASLRSPHSPSAFAFLAISGRHGASLSILTSLHAPFPPFTVVYVHARGLLRPCEAHPTDLVAQITTCPTTTPKGVHLDLEVQLRPHPSKTRCICSDLGPKAGCNCFPTGRGRVQLLQGVEKRGVTAPSTLGMPLPTPRTTRTRVFCASNMRGMATRSNRTTSNTTKRHALAQPPSRCVRRKNSVLGRAPRGHVFAAEEDDARATLRFAHETK